MKIKKKMFFLGGRGGRRGEGSGLGGQDGCDLRIEVFVRIQKKNIWGGSGWGVRVDVNEELKFLGKLKKKQIEGGGGGAGGGVGSGGGQVRGVGLVVGSGWMLTKN